VALSDTQFREPFFPPSEIFFYFFFPLSLGFFRFFPLRASKDAERLILARFLACFVFRPPPFFAVCFSLGFTTCRS